MANAAGWRAIRRRTLGRLPFPRLASDVTGVVYANWLIPAARAQECAPPRVRLAEHAGETLLTVLSYRHGHFGPSMTGPARRLFPSPLQSNWRCYVAAIDEAPPTRPTVLFLRNIFDMALYAVGSRMLSDALPSHLAADFTLRDDGQAIAVSIDGGNGSAPSLALRATRASARAGVPDRFARWFGADRDPLAVICLQDAAIVAAGPDVLAEAWIDLPVALETIEPLAVEAFTPGPLLTTLGAADPPWCFHVPAVPFRVLGEHLLRAGPPLTNRSRPAWIAS